MDVIISKTAGHLKSCIGKTDPLGQYYPSLAEVPGVGWASALCLFNELTKTWIAEFDKRLRGT